MERNPRQPSRSRSRRKDAAPQIAIRQPPALRTCKHAVGAWTVGSEHPEPLGHAGSQWQDPARVLRLQFTDLAAAVLASDPNARTIAEVDIAPLQTRSLRDAKAGVGQELEEQPLWVMDSGEEPGQLCSRHGARCLPLGLLAT